MKSAARWRADKQQNKALEEFCLCQPSEPDRVGKQPGGALGQSGRGMFMTKAARRGPSRSGPGRALQGCGAATFNNKVLFVALNAERIIFRGHLT